jgi:aminopeptidase N
MLYYEQVYGKERAQAILRGEFERSYQSLLRQGRDMPAGLSSEDYPPDLYWDVVYDKGALYFHELREAVGDEAFFEILQTYYQRHRYEIATPEMFLDAVEAVTGDPQQEIYTKWIGERAD